MQPCICETISVRSFVREDKIGKLTFLFISFRPSLLSLSLFFLLSSITFPLLFLLSLLPQKKLSPNLSESRETCMRLRILMVGSPCISRCSVSESFILKGYQVSLWLWGPCYPLFVLSLGCESYLFLPSFASITSTTDPTPANVANGKISYARCTKHKAFTS